MLFNMELTEEQKLDNDVAVRFMGLKTELRRQYLTVKSILNSNPGLNSNPDLEDQQMGEPDESGPYRDYFRVLDSNGVPASVIYLPGGVGDWVVDRYSTDISCAMRVMDRLRHSNDYCCLSMKEQVHPAGSGKCDGYCIELKSDYHYVWDVWLTRSGLSDWDSAKAHEPCVMVCDTSLPKAICLAALATLDLEKEEELNLIQNGARPTPIRRRP